MSTKHGPCAFCVADEYGYVCTGACDKLTAAPTRAEFEAAAYRYICDNSATYPSAKAPIQLIVQESSILHTTHGQAGYRKGLDEHFAAAMG